MCKPDLEMAYQMECCGDLPTDWGKINKCLREVKQAAAQGITEISIDTENFTPDQLDYLIKELEKIL